MDLTAREKPLIEHDSVAQKVGSEIKAMILSGQLPAGQPISEVELAEYLQVSRTPVREALRELARQGLVSIPPRRRAIVASIDEKDAADIALVRTTLERLICSLLVDERKDAIDFPAMEAAAEGCFERHQAGDVAGAIECDSRFHLELAKQTNNIHLYHLYADFMPKIQLLRLRQSMPRNGMLPFFKQHGQIIKLLKAGKKDELDALLGKHIIHGM